MDCDLRKRTVAILLIGPIKLISEVDDDKLSENEWKPQITLTKKERDLTKRRGKKRKKKKKKKKIRLGLTRQCHKNEYKILAFPNADI